MYSARKLVWEMTLWLRLGICRAAGGREQGRLPRSHAMHSRGTWTCPGRGQQDPCEPALRAHTGCDHQS